MYRLAREKTCVIRGEKCDDRSDLVGLPDLSTFPFRRVKFTWAC
jgi:hypothetical protein